MIVLREITVEESAAELVWAANMPLWWQEADKSVSRRTSGPKSRIGVIVDDELVAIYTLQEVGPKIIDAHLSCRRGVESTVIVESALALKRQLIASGFVTIFLWPLRQNFGLIGIAKLCGFKSTGVRMLSGILGNRPAEWVQLGASNV